MSEGTSRARPALAGYYNADLRGLAREVRQQLREADLDSDIASVTILSMGPRDDVLRADGAVVVIKGGSYVELFMQWAARNGLLTRGKPIVDPHRPGGGGAYMSDLDPSDRKAVIENMGAGFAPGAPLGRVDRLDEFCEGCGAARDEACKAGCPVAGDLGGEG
jgi:hypothetical protein